MAINSSGRRAKVLLDTVFRAAISSAMPAESVIASLPEKPTGRCVVVGAGKAAAAMAAAVDTAWQDVDLSGIVSTRYEHAVPAGRVEVIEAGHPVPDRNSEVAAMRMLEKVRNLTADDLVLALFSGGGSATLALAVEPLTLEAKQNITSQLLKSGASITEMNVIRTHLSRIKGGRLAEAAAPARLHTLVISDVPGDDPALIASGPTFPCNSAAADALGLIDRYHLNIPDELRHYLGAQPDRSCNGPCNDHTMIASPAQALRAAAEEAKKAGITPLILGDAIEGESKELGRTMAGIARSIRSLNEPVRAPAMLISGGETTVTIGPHGAGRGGRNTEFLLSLAIALDGDAGIYALAGDSDGIDGTEDAAGAFISPDTLSRAQSVGLMPKDFLDRHDSYSLFDALGDLIRTGPTLTNVNDIRLVMVTNEATGNAT